MPIFVGLKRSDSHRWWMRLRFTPEWSQRVTTREEKKCMFVTAPRLLILMLFDVSVQLSVSASTWMSKGKQIFDESRTLHVYRKKLHASHVMLVKEYQWSFWNNNRVVVVCRKWAQVGNVLKLKSLFHSAIAQARRWFYYHPRWMYTLFPFETSTLALSLPYFFFVSSIFLLTCSPVLVVDRVCAVFQLNDLRSSNSPTGKKNIFILNFWVTVRCCCSVLLLLYIPESVCIFQE